MFGFLRDMDNYEDRCVGRHDAEWGFISTARVSDGIDPFETAVCHDRYRDDGEMVIVEAYPSKTAAEAGHAKWVATMTAEVLPEVLTDCCNAELSDLAFSERPQYSLRSSR